MINSKSKIALFIVAILVFSVLLAGCGKDEGTIAKVNGEIITKAKFDKTFEMQKRVIEQQAGEDVWGQDVGEGVTFEEMIKERILENLIREEILLQEAKKDEVEVTDKEVSDELAKVKDLKVGEENFKNALEQSGMTEEYLKDGLRNEMTINAYKKKYLESIDINEESARNYFDENKENYLLVRARHILVETLEEAKEIENSLNAGGDFAEIAKEKSIDTGSGAQGGDLGYFGKGRMVPEFENAVFSLNEGETSDPVQSEFGYHIIRLEEKIDTFEEVKDDVKLDLENEKFNNKVEELLEDSKIERYLDTENE